MDSQTLLAYRRLIFRRPRLRICFYGFCVKLAVSLFILYVLAAVKIHDNSRANTAAGANYTKRTKSQHADSSAAAEKIGSYFNIWTIPPTRVTVADVFLPSSDFNGTGTERYEIDGNTTTGLDLNEQLIFDADPVTIRNVELKRMKFCSKQKIDYVGRFPIFELNDSRIITKLFLRHSRRFYDIYHNSSIINHGGWWTPNSVCSSKYRKPVAIVIPFRNRSTHLKILLSFLHPIVQKQLIDYRIFVVEQHGNGTFNKGILMNSAFALVKKMFPRYECVIFHDVDLIPETDNNTYTCAKGPKHMSPAVSKFAYQLSYQELIGGVLAISTENFIKVNGYSNEYWGWGGEDDDMYKRLKLQWLSIERPDNNTARYYMLKHDKRTWLSHSHTYALLGSTRKRYLSEGLNSASQLTEHLQLTELPFYTHILVKFKKSAPAA